MVAIFCQHMLTYFLGDILYQILLVDTEVEYHKCDTKRCQISNLVDTRPSFTLPGSPSIIKPGSFSCNSSYLVYLISCHESCDGEGNYIGETSTKFRFRINNHKTSIRNNTPGHPVANDFNKNNHAANDLRCCILKGKFKSNKER